MGNLNAAAQGDLALASVTGGAVPVYAMNRGFAAAITRTGAGDVTLTLSDAQNLSTNAIVSATLAGATLGQIACEVVSTTQIRVRTSIADGTATDKSFWIRVTPVSPQ